MAEQRELKPGWTLVKFGDVVKLSNARCAHPAAEGIERYVGLEHIDPDDLRIRRWELVKNGITFTTLFKAGQVLFGKRRAYQRKVAVADFEGVCSHGIKPMFNEANTVEAYFRNLLCGNATANVLSKINSPSTSTTPISPPPL